MPVTGVPMGIAPPSTRAPATDEGPVEMTTTRPSHTDTHTAAAPAIASTTRRFIKSADLTPPPPGRESRTEPEHVAALRRRGRAQLRVGGAHALGMRHH